MQILDLTVQRLGTSLLGLLQGDSSQRMLSRCKWFIRAASSKAPNDIANEVLESLSCHPMITSAIREPNYSNP